MSKPKPNLRAVFGKEQAQPAAPMVADEPAREAPPQAKLTRGKVSVLIKIPRSLHKDLKTVALADDTHITTITEQLLRKFLVSKGYTAHAPEQ